MPFDPSDPLGFLALTRSMEERVLSMRPAVPPAPPLGLGSRILGTAGAVLGAPKAGVDWLARAGARGLYGLELPDTATTGGILREAAGLSTDPTAGQEGNAESYARRLAGAGLEFTGDILTDPTVAVATAKAPAAVSRLASVAGRVLPAAVAEAAIPAIVPRAASLGFTGLMAAATVEGARQAAETVHREGLSPAAVEELFHTTAAGLGAVAGLRHAVARRTQVANAPDAPAAAAPDLQPERPELTALVRASGFEPAQKPTQAWLAPSQNAPEARLDPSHNAPEARLDPSVAVLRPAVERRNRAPRRVEAPTIDAEWAPVDDIGVAVARRALRDGIRALPPREPLALPEAPAAPTRRALPAPQEPAVPQPEPRTIYESVLFANPDAPHRGGQDARVRPRFQNWQAPDGGRRYRYVVDNKGRKAAVVGPWARTQADAAAAFDKAIRDRVSLDEQTEPWARQTSRIAPEAGGDLAAALDQGTREDVAASLERPSVSVRGPQPRDPAEFERIGSELAGLLGQRPQGGPSAPVETLARIPFAEPLRDVNEKDSGLAIERARANLAAGQPGTVQIDILPDGQQVITDGRHTLAAAREAGVASLPVRVIDAEGNTVSDLDARVRDASRSVSATVETAPDKPASTQTPRAAAPRNIERVGSASEFKRRAQEVNDDFYYHVTTPAAAKAILKDGLKPGSKPTMGAGFYRDYSKGKIFLTERQGVSFWRDRIEEHLEQQVDKVPKLVVLRIPKGAVEGVVDDVAGTRDARVPSYYIDKALAAKAKPKSRGVGPGAGPVETVPQDLGQVATETRFAARERQAPRGFYSALERVAERIPQPMKGADMLRYLRDPKRAVKADELKWTGLDEFLESRRGATVTPAEVRDFLAQNRVEVREVTKGVPSKARLDELDARLRSEGRLSPDEAAEYTRLTDAEAFPKSGANATKYSQYQEPGGENYREVLLTLPARSPSFEQWMENVRALRPERWEAFRMDPERAQRAYRGALQEGTAGDAPGNFTGGHFDEPNILAHVRLNDRVDADGKRVLFIEELQSDWAQKGRREGFGPPYSGVEGNRVSGIPSAPFVDDTGKWTDLALKRILRMASEEGYDRVAWTTGEMQAARYDLSKQVDAVAITKIGADSYDIDIVKDGAVLSEIQPRGISLQEVEDTVGKDLARRAEAQPQGHVGEYSGLDLKVGGEGMSGYYDKIVPQAAERLGKKFGARVGETEIGTVPDNAWLRLDDTRDGVERYEVTFGNQQRRVEGLGDDWRIYDGRTEIASAGSLAAAKAEAAGDIGGSIQRVHSIDITPQLRKAATEEGFPLFAARAEAEGVASTMNLGRVQRAFRGAKFTEEGGVFRGRVNGVAVEVRPDASITIVDPGALAASAAARGLGPGAVPVGATLTLGNRVLVQLAKGAEDNVIDHEAMHVAMRLALNDGERRAVLRDHGFDGRKFKGTDAERADAMLEAEERAADAYSRWTPDQPNGLFARIHAFFKRMVRQFFPDAQEVFRRVREGEAFGRTTGRAEQPTGVTFATKAAEAAPTPAEPGPPKPGIKDKAVEAWKAGLLSGIPTHIANTVGNAIKQGVTLAETAVGGGLVDPLLSRLHGRERERWVSDAAASWAGIKTAAPAAIRDVVGGIREAFTLAPERAVSGKAESRGAIGGKTGRAVRIPFRLLEAVDTGWKTLAREQELFKIANRQQRAGGQKADAFISEFRADPEAERFTGVRDAMEQAALRETFQGPPDESKVLEAAAQAVGSLSQRYHGLQLIFPFTRTPSKIATATLERTPYGFKYALDTYKRFKAWDAYDRARSAGNAEAVQPRGSRVSAGEVSDALARPLLGTLLGGVFATYAQSGAMTGSGPTGRDERAALLASGWRPYSFVVRNDDGTTTYVPFSRFEPVSSIIGFAADLAETSNAKDAEDIVSKIGGSIVENLTNKTFLAGLEGASNALSDPKRYASTFVRNLAGSVVPSIVGRAAQAIDPVGRETRPEDEGALGFGEGVTRTLMARIPWLSATLPARRAGTGLSYSRGGAVAGGLERFVSPAVTSRSVAGRGLEELLVQLDAAPSATRRQITLAGRPYRLTDAEMGLYDQADAAVTNILRSQFQRLKALPPEQAKQVIDTLYAAGRAQARARVLASPGVIQRLRAAS